MVIEVLERAAWSVAEQRAIEMQTTQPLDPEFIVLAWPLANYYGVNSIGRCPRVRRPKCTGLRMHT